MNILADFHHSDLFMALQLLFEERLGGKLFRPVGTEWREKGFWKYCDLYNDAFTQNTVTEQFLGAREDRKIEEGLFERANLKHNSIDNLITLDKFYKMPIDIVICTVQIHEESFYRLAKSHPNKPKFIRQIANIGEVPNPQFSKNVMWAAPLFKDIEGISNYVYYHQEFDLSIFRPEEAKEKKVINLMNCLSLMPENELWKKYKEALSEINWKMHGQEGEDGNLNTVFEITNALKETQFLWHLKKWGYGFVFYNALACGVPIIMRGLDHSQYEEGAKILKDLETCIDLDVRSFEDNIKVIREYSEPEKYKKMSENVYKKFQEVCNFDKEAEEIKLFLEKLE